MGACPQIGRFELSRHWPAIASALGQHGGPGLRIKQFIFVIIRACLITNFFLLKIRQPSVRLPP